MFVSRRVTSCAVLHSADGETTFLDKEQHVTTVVAVYLPAFFVACKLVRCRTSLPLPGSCRSGFNPVGAWLSVHRYSLAHMQLDTDRDTPPIRDRKGHCPDTPRLNNGSQIEPAAAAPSEHLKTDTRTLYMCVCWRTQSGTHKATHLNPLNNTQAWLPIECARNTRLAPRHQ